MSSQHAVAHSYAWFPQKIIIPFMKNVTKRTSFHKLLDLEWERNALASMELTNCRRKKVFRSACGLLTVSYQRTPGAFWQQSHSKTITLFQSFFQSHLFSIIRVRSGQAATSSPLQSNKFPDSAILRGRERIQHSAVLFPSSNTNTYYRIQNCELAWRNNFSLLNLCERSAFWNVSIGKLPHGWELRCTNNSSKVVIIVEWETQTQNGASYLAVWERERTCSPKN